MELVEFGFRIVHKLIPNWLVELMTSDIQNITMTNSYGYNTRNRYIPKIIKHKKNITNRSFMCKSISKFNSLPQFLKTCDNLKLFKKKYILFFYGNKETT